MRKVARLYDGSDSRVSSEIDKVAPRENKIEIPRICYASLGIRSTSSVFRHAAHRPRKRLNFGCGLGRAQNASKTRRAQLSLRSRDLSDCYLQSSTFRGECDMVCRFISGLQSAT